MTLHSTPPRIAFFGTPQLSVWVLDALAESGMQPALIVTNPDAPRGRRHLLTPSPVAEWAEEHGVETLKLETLRDPLIPEALRASGCDLFIVAAYGKLIPEEILSIPKYKTLNVHPSLLPKLRGASPVRTAILLDMNPTGVSIMELTPGMDEGPILAQEEIHIPKENWPIRGSELDELLFKKGSDLLCACIPKWTAGNITAIEQDHGNATYCTKITKEMGEINVHDDPYKNLLKIRAFDGWPGTFFFQEKHGEKVRVKITDAELAPDGSLKITRVVPEGKKEMDYSDFIRS